MQRTSGEKTAHIETIITKGIKFSPLLAGSRIGLKQTVAEPQCSNPEVVKSISKPAPQTQQNIKQLTIDET